MMVTGVTTSDISVRCDVASFWAKIEASKYS